ncbi:MAG: WD40-repeat-containing domain protein [Piptocephalis tieghemiana]|nr:MAG: WD40-repeat-containing domain protein [Piptocephalis tieghemiana]
MTTDGPIAWDKFHLRRIIRENHGKPIVAIAAHPPSPRMSPPNRENIIATLGGSQCNIYDTAHCGPHTDLISQYVAPNDVHLTCLTWMPFWPEESDAIIAIGDETGTVRLLSLTRSAELARLIPESDNAPGQVLEVHPLRGSPHLLTLHSDGVRLWDAFSALCLHHLSFKASKAVCALAPLPATDDAFYLGTRNGDLSILRVQHLEGTWNLVKDTTLYTASQPIRSIQISKDHGVLVQLVSGKLIHLTDSGDVVKTIPGPKEASFPYMTPQGTHTLIGDQQGALHIISLDSGKVDRVLRHKRATRAIHASVVMSDGRRIYVVGQDGCIWGWEEVSEEELAKWEAWKVMAQKASERQ